MAKLFATETAQQVIDTAIQFHGAAALERGHILEALYRDVRALRIYEGASEIQREIIAREALPLRQTLPAREGAITSPDGRRTAGSGAGTEGSSHETGSVRLRSSGDDRRSTGAAGGARRRRDRSRGWAEPRADAESPAGPASAS